MSYSVHDFFEAWVLPILKKVVRTTDSDERYTLFNKELRDLLECQADSRVETCKGYFKRDLLVTAVGETTIEDFITKALELYISDDENVRVKKIVFERGGKEITIDYKGIDNTDALADLLNSTQFVELVSESVHKKLNAPTPAV